MKTSPESQALISYVSGLLSGMLLDTRRLPVAELHLPLGDACEGFSVTLASGTRLRITVALEETPATPEE